MIDFKTFEQAIGISFDDKKLLKQAFTHRSYLNEHEDEGLEHNERLEFLGDAVLELVVTHFLYNTFPDKPEGELTAIRAALVNTNTISACAKEIGMNDFMLLSRGESKSTGRARQYILANAFEALVGSMYLDQGYDVVRNFIEERVLSKLAEIMEKRLWEDAKSHFQEVIQEKVGVTPTYEVLTEEGPDHDKIFTVGVFVKSELVAEGRGRSKQDAEQEAAHVALNKKDWGEF